MFYYRNEISTVVLAIICFACIVGFSNMCSCSGSIPIPIETVGDACNRRGDVRCNGDTVETCTGRQWVKRWDCSAITVDGEPMPQRCVHGRCE